MTNDELVRQLERIREGVRERLAEATPPRIHRPADPPVAGLVSHEPPTLPSDPHVGTTPHLERANALVSITAPTQMVSRVRFFGPVLTLLRRLARPLVQPILDPYLDRQEKFNDEVTRHLNELGDRLERRLAGMNDVFAAGLADPLALEARLEAALSDYDTALRQKHTLLFDGLEEELWALQNRVADSQRAAQQALTDFDVRFTRRAQAVDLRFDEKDTALEEAFRGRGVEVDRAEFMETRAVLQELLEQARRAPSRGSNAEAAEGEGGASPQEALDGELWRRLRAWMADDEYRAFQGQFRGDPQEIGSRMRSHVEHFAEVPGPIVDLGCGRGEFLDLLLEAGHAAIGVEINEAEVRSCTERGLDVVQSDLFAWLEEREAQSLGGIFLAQVIEHLPPPDWARLVRLAASRLQPGGRLVIETINPESLYALSRAYVLDPTHIRPVHPELLAFFAARSGFGAVQIRYQAPVPDTQRILPVADDAVTGAPEWEPVLHEINDRLRRIDSFCCAPQEYALVATKVGSTAAST